MYVDKLDYHLDAAEAEGASEDAAGTHIVCFILWADQNRLTSPELHEFLAKVEGKSLSKLAKSILDRYVGKLTESDLTEPGVKFIKKNYDKYLSLYGTELVEAQGKFYNEIDDDVFETAKVILTQLHQEWSTKKWWQFWK